MESLLQHVVDRALRARKLSREDLAYKVLPYFLAEIVRKYLRVTVAGLENVPKKGAFIIISNHSGYMGFDAVMLGHEVKKGIGRIPRIIAHKLWFLRPEISVRAAKFGLIPATFENGLKLLKRKEGLLLFPEGEEGNFKPSSQRYKLRRFRRGFVRLALMTGAPIIPAMVIGAEETHLTLSQIRWAKDLLGIIIPVPLNVIPLPAKWTIVFGDPIHLPKDPAKAEDMVYVTKLSRQIRRDLQRSIHTELKTRGNVYL